MYKVEPNIPLPKAGFRNEKTRLINSLNIGDSFQFPKKDRSKIASIAAWLKRTGDFDYTIRSVDEDNCRFWRLNSTKP